LGIPIGKLLCFPVTQKKLELPQRSDQARA
jgi:hypothetical protein